MFNDMIPLPSSPTISSSSSSLSDPDNESTGSSSFFHDRSTSLGALMGLSFPTINFPTPSNSQYQPRLVSTDVARSGAGQKKKKQSLGLSLTSEKRRRWWWSLCRDEAAEAGSLEEFLKVDREFYGGLEAAELEGIIRARPSQSEVRQRVLFSEGRVLPPHEPTSTMHRRFMILGAAAFRNLTPI